MWSVWGLWTKSRTRFSVVPGMPPVAVWPISMWVTGFPLGSSSEGLLVSETERVIVARPMALRVSQEIPCCWVLVLFLLQSGRRVVWRGLTSLRISSGLLERVSFCDGGVC